MEFTGKHQAFIAAMFNVRLKEKYGKQGEKVFIHAGQCYAEQRGHRMAQRALRDGRDLDPQAYEQYRELLAGHEIDFKQMTPDFVMHVMKCEWADTYDELGLVEEGLLYCSNVDLALSRGFNPFMNYDMRVRAEGCRCVHHIKDANFGEGTDLRPVPGCSQSIEYHCGNMFWVFAQTAEAVLGAGGVRVAARVLEDFEEKFGAEMADRLVLYRNLNYDVCNGGTV